MKKRLFLLTILCILAVLCFVSCEDGPDADGNYTLTFVVDGEKTKVKCKGGEYPEYPDVAPKMQGDDVMVFDDWSPSITEAVGNTTYTATFREAVDGEAYAVTWDVGGVKTTEAYAFRTVPTYKGKTKFSSGNVVGFYPKIAEARENVTYTAVLSDEYVLSGDELMEAVNTPLITLTSRARITGTEYFNGCTALEILALEERSNPQDSAVAARAVEQLRSVLNGNEPLLDAAPTWSMSILAVAIALCKDTPTIWNRLTKAETEKFDLLMRAYCYLASYATDVDNAYSTGPSLGGNYYYGVNYIFANCPQILAASHYFGGGDKTVGAAAVNRILRDFDYDTVLEELKDADFDNIVETWTAEGPNGCTSESIMQNGGTAYGYSNKTAKTGTVNYGTGHGVIPTHKDGYRFKNRAFSADTNIYLLSEPDKILNSLFAYCYSGGVCVADSSTLSRGLDGKGKPLAYTVNDPDGNPALGYNGMMCEFNAGDAGGPRFSAVYCDHDFVLSVAMMLGFESLGYWSAEESSSVCTLAIVGNTDLIYKLSHGFMSYSKGAYDSTSPIVEQGYGGYYMLKSAWYTYLCPLVESYAPTGLEDWY